MTIKEAQAMMCSIQESEEHLAGGLKRVGFSEEQVLELAHTFEVLNFAGMVVDGRVGDAKKISKGITYILTDAIMLGVILGAYGAVIPEGMTIQ